MLTRRLFWATVLLVLFGFGAVSAISSEKEETTETIPLKSVYATFRQKSVEYLDELDARKSIRFALRQLDARSRSGAMNIYLVRAVDYSTAMTATSDLLVRSLPADRPEGIESEKSKLIWVAAYLGSREPRRRRGRCVRSRSAGR
jgi:hypothetical protein